MENFFTHGVASHYELLTIVDKNVQTCAVKGSNECTNCAIYSYKIHTAYKSDCNLQLNSII